MLTSCVGYFQIPGLCKNFVSPYVWNSTLLKSQQCDEVVGYLAVYRVCFAMAGFFFLFCLLMIKVKSSKDPRAKIQNGWVSCVSRWSLGYHVLTHPIHLISYAGWVKFLKRLEYCQNKHNTLRVIFISKPSDNACTVFTRHFPKAIETFPAFVSYISHSPSV